MAYTDDWESLMNGVFGAGGRLKFGSGTQQPEAKQPKGTGSLPDLNAALLEQQKQLDELLKKQNAQLKGQDDAAQAALENSRQMLRDMEQDCWPKARQMQSRSIWAALRGWLPR